MHRLTGLMSCSHVNKKALDQYTNFTEQREELARRQTENGRGEDKIKQLIQTLDMRKDEAIERTFKVITLHDICSYALLGACQVCIISHSTSTGLPCSRM